jgi:hypothetical protein
MSAIKQFIELAHLKTCGANMATDCNDTCAGMKDDASAKLAAYRELAEAGEDLRTVMLESYDNHRSIGSEFKRFAAALDKIKA